MPRTARVVVPGLPHHITQRGNNRQDVFFVDEDRKTYLELLKKMSEEENLQVLGYCLMTNHIHLVCVPEREKSLSRTMARAHLVYAQYINRLHGRTGHLWQNRFYSCVLEESRLWAALRYVERNPVRAQIVRRAWNYEWSSARAHVGERDESGALDLEGWETVMGAEEWKEQLARPDSVEELGLLRSRTRHGRPLGGDSFVSKLEVRLGRRLRPLPRGRPKQRGGRAQRESRRKSG